jgi:hypothetical protein
MCVHTKSYKYSDFVSEFISGKGQQYFLCIFGSFYCSHAVYQCCQCTRVNVLLSEMCVHLFHAMVCMVVGMDHCVDGVVSQDSSSSASLIAIEVTLLLWICVAAWWCQARMITLLSCGECQSKVLSSQS